MRAMLMALALTLSVAANADSLCDILRDAKIIAQDDKNTYLGRISNKFAADSIFNSYGEFGNPYSGTSIWNTYAEFGNPYSSHSVANAYSMSPPMLIKDGKIIGYLSVNKSIKNAVSANLLKALCEDEL